MLETQVIGNIVERNEISINKIKNSVDLANFVKGIKKEELLEFAKEYLKKHSFVSSKKLSTGFLYERYGLTYRCGTYILLRKALLNRFSYIIMLFNQGGLIAGYNSSSLYKRVDDIH